MLKLIPIPKVFVGSAETGPNPLELSFDHDQLAHHDMVIEHDLSLTRTDASTRNNCSFNQTILDAVPAFYDGMEIATIPITAKAKYNRVQTESSRDLTLTYGPVRLYSATARG